MGVGPVLYMYDVVVKRSRSLSHLLMSSCLYGRQGVLAVASFDNRDTRKRIIATEH